LAPGRVRGQSKRARTGAAARRMGLDSRLAALLFSSLCPTLPARFCRRMKRIMAREERRWWEEQRVRRVCPPLQECCEKSQ